MKVLKQDLREGFILVCPDSMDDLWHLDKILEKGDLITARTTRKFVSESGKKDRKEVRIKLSLESVDFKAFSDRLHLLGTIEEGKPEKYVSLGSHHSVDVGPGTVIGVIKKKWKKHQLNRLKDAVKASRRPKIVVTALDDEEAEIVLLREFGLDRKATISSGKSGKQFEGKDVKEEYFHEIAKALEHLESQKLIVAGPGFTKDEFMDFCKEKYPDLAEKTVVDNVGQGGITGVKEVLKRGIVDRICEETRISRETQLVEKVLAEISREGLVTYGLKDVKKALDYGAVETLLVIDSLFSKKRDEIESLMDSAESARAEAHVISSEHDAGQQLEAIGGIAALLRFKIE
jgi:protein pelota